MPKQSNFDKFNAINMSVLNEKIKEFKEIFLNALKIKITFILESHQIKILFKFFKSISNAEPKNRAG